MVDCLEDCGEDNVCSSSCYREQVICIDSWQESLAHVMPVRESCSATYDK